MTKSQMARVFAVLAWTSVCGGLWLLWTYGVVMGSGESADPVVDAGAIVGGAACTTGCMGGIWFMGLVVAALVWALVRR